MNILKDALLKIHIENAKKFNYLNIHFHNSMFFGIYNEKLYHKHANAILLTLITAVIYLKFNFVIKTILTIVWSIEVYILCTASAYKNKQKLSRIYLQIKVLKYLGRFYKV